MAKAKTSGIFTLITKSNEIKGKEVTVKPEGILDDESGEVIKFADIFKPLIGEVVNFSIKVTEKDEAEFEIPESEEDDE